MIVIVGSKSLWPTPNLASTILSIIISSTDHAIGLRSRADHTPSSMTEMMVERIAERTEHVVHYYVPGPKGSSTGFFRDNDMVKNASHVYAFFAPGEEMKGGTGHVVEAALRYRVPVTAYHLDGRGNVVEYASEGGTA